MKPTTSRSTDGHSSSTFNLRAQQILLLATGLSLVFSLGCGSSTPKTITPEPENAPLQANMQNMGLLVKRLMPVLVDKHSFESASQEGRIKKDITQLSRIAQSVSHSDYKKHADPSFGFLSEGFRDELARSVEAFDQGKKEYARYSLLNMTSYCIECHTRTASGPAFQSPEFDQTLNRLAPLEKGEYLLSIRSFDPALEEFLKVIESKDGKAFNFYDFDRAIRYALSITVKFQRDPIKTERVIDLVMKEDKLPYFLRQAATSWKTSVQAWKKEKPSKKPSLKQRLDHASKLIRQGKQAQHGQSDRSGDVDLLRGLSELHQILLTDLKPAEKGQSLYLTGLGYESVRELSLWSLHENYYETCIHTVPHSAWARRCYKALEESLFLGYTGSAGTDIPQDVRDRLAALRKIAEDKTAEKPAESAPEKN